MIFEARHTFTISDGEVDIARRNVLIQRNGDDYSDPGFEVEVTGLHENDFALFADVLTLDDDTSGAREFGYFVISTANKVSKLINSDYVLDFPEMYVSPHLARLLQSAPRHELEQFTIEPVLEHIDRAFPPK